MRFLALLGLLVAGLLAGDDATLPAGAAGDPRNHPPVCAIATPPVVACTGGLVDVVLDASASSDPDGDPLDYLWTSGCEGGVVADPTAPVTTLTIDTSVLCDTTCAVRLRVRDGNFSSTCRTLIELETPVFELDIRPGQFPNWLQVSPGAPLAGVLPISLVGSKTAMPGNIDVESLQLGRVEPGGTGFAAALFTTLGPDSVDIVDDATPFDGPLCEGHALDGDGLLDLRMRFDRDLVVSRLNLENEPNLSFVPLRVSGRLLDGTPFFADDCVRILGGQ